MAQRTTSRKPRSSGASRRGGAKKRGSVPGWVWLVTGVLVGIFAAFLIYLARFDSSWQPPFTGKAKEIVAQTEPPKQSTPKEKPPSDSKTVTEAKTKPATSTKTPDTPKEKPAVNYDFYKILPQYEVVVPEEDSPKPTTTPATSPGTYYLQVGAFRHMQEADSRKAELAMLGIVSSIQTVTLEPGNTWHRVRIGPVRDMRELDRTKRKLQDNNIAFVTLKEKS